MTDDATPQDEADSADLEAARSRLFDAPADDEQEPEEQPRPEGDHVPGEGDSPPTSHSDDGARAFARKLFDSDN